MAKRQNIISNGSVESKGVAASKAYNYSAFGWTRAKGAVPAGTKVKKKEQAVLIKRRVGYGQDPELRRYEDEYLKREKKRYRQLPILGILTFFLMIAFLAVAGVEFYFGISQGLERMNPTGTYNYYNDNGEKDDYPLFELTKDTWAYRTTDAETPSDSGKLVNKVTMLELYETVDDEIPEDAAPLFVITVNRGVITFLDAPSQAMIGTKYFSDKSKLAEKYTMPQAEENNDASSAPANADDDAEPEAGEEEAAAPSEGILDKVVGILNKYHDAYITKVTGFLDGEATAATTDGEGEAVPAQMKGGFISGIAEKIGSPIGCFISGDTVVALVALILFILMAIFFSAITKKKKKRRENEARKMQLLQLGRQRVMELQRTNPVLMGKAQRKAFMWETILTNALRNAGVGGGSSAMSDDEEYDFD